MKTAHSSRAAGRGPIADALALLAQALVHAHADSDDPARLQQAAVGIQLVDAMPSLIQIASGTGAAFADARAATDATVAGHIDDSLLRSAAIRCIRDLYLTSGDDPYRVLGLNPWAGEQEVRDRYRQLIRLFHPDRGSLHEQIDPALAATLNLAYARANQQRVTHARATARQQPPQPQPQQSPAQHRAPPQSRAGDAPHRADNRRHGANQQAASRPLPNKSADARLNRPGSSGLAERWHSAGLFRLSRSGVWAAVALLSVLVVVSAWLGRAPADVPVLARAATERSPVKVPAVTAPAITASSITASAVTTPAFTAPQAKVTSEWPVRDDRPVSATRQAPISTAKATAMATATTNVAATATAAPTPSPIRPTMAADAVRPLPAPTERAALKAQPLPTKTNPSIEPVLAVATSVSPPPPSVPERANAAAPRPPEADQSFASSLDEIEHFLANFLGSYANGDLEQLLSLMQDNLSYDQPGGKAAARRTYQRLFQASTSRDLVLRDVVWNRYGGRMVASPRFEERVTLQSSGSIQVQKGVMHIELIDHGGKISIVSLSHKTIQASP